MKMKKALALAFTVPMSVALADSEQLLNGSNTATIQNTQLLVNTEFQADTNQIQNEPINVNGTTLFLEDFQSESIPAGWVLVNNDGLTPDPNVATFTEAWNVFAEQAGDPAQFTAQSNSWYSPPGTADDWMISPAISIGSDAVLSWLAASFDPNFLDSYEVYVSTSTQDMAGCMANAAVFSVAAEVADVLTPHSVDLALAGFTNTSIHVCFRNNSVDKFILEVDDIMVTETGGVSNDVVIIDASLPQYTVVPKLFGHQTDLMYVDIMNNGSLSQSNLTLTVEIIVDGVVTENVDVPVTGPIDPGNTLDFELGSYFVGLDSFDVRYTVSLDGVSDENPANNTTLLTGFMFTDNKMMARDDGTATGALGVGAGNGAALGQSFIVPEGAILESVFFTFQNTSCDDMTGECGLDNLDITADVYATDGMGVPTTVLASTESFTVPTGLSAHSPQLDLVGGPFTMTAGTYVVAINEPIDPNPGDTLSTSVSLFYTDTRYTPGTTWINWPTIPGGEWSNNEAFGFPNSYVIRPMFVDPDEIFINGFE